MDRPQEARHRSSRFPRAGNQKRVPVSGSWLLAASLSALGVAVGLPCGSQLAETAEQTASGHQPDWPAVIAQLREQLDDMPENVRLRQQLAVAYNNYGVSLGEQGRLGEAAQHMEHALQLDSSNNQLRHNLAIMYLQAARAAYRQSSRQPQLVKESIDRALAVQPNTAEAYVMLGELEYANQHLKEAQAAWRKALTINPALEEATRRLAQVSQELPVESKFERLSQFYFDIRYTDALEHVEGFDIRETLLTARRVIGSDFAYWPEHKLVVLIYSAQQFRQLRQNSPEWVGGQFDGKIRVPLPSHEFDQKTITRILFHEYTHALIYDLTNGQCPAWLNEGLAEHEAWKGTLPSWTQLRQAVAAGRLVPWTDLSNQFSASSSAQDAALAYEQAQSMVQYLVEHYGFWHMKHLLHAVAKETPLETAMATEFHLKPPRLEDNWRTWLQRLLTASP